MGRADVRRGPGPERRAPLRSDPSKTAAWQARGRAQGLSRGGALARKPLKAAARAPRPVTPANVWAEVLRRDGGRCVWSRLLGVDGRAEHPHHLLPKGAGGWPEFAGERANVVGLTAGRHMTHEHSPRDRLPWEALPAECRAFLLSVAAVDPRAERLIAVKYPAGGARRSDEARRSA